MTNGGYVPVTATLLKVGTEVFPIYGDEASGWSMNAEDFSAGVPARYRYRSLDELFFALVNFNISDEGQA